MPDQQTVSQCHCEEVKRPKQSHKILKTNRLPRSLRSLAMTKKDCDTVWQAGIQTENKHFWIPAPRFRGDRLHGNDKLGMKKLPDPSINYSSHLRQQRGQG